jgi:hypothetical protein
LWQCAHSVLEIGHRFLRFFFRRNWSWMKAAASTANSGRG